MNKKGQAVGVGVIIVVAIALIVGVIFFQAIAQQAGETTNTVVVTNESLGAAASPGVVQYLTNYRSLTSVVIMNATDDAVIPAANYTVVNNVVNDGALAVSIEPSTYLNESGWDSGLWQVSGTAQPLTYVPDSGSRGIISLIVIFFAVALVAVALYPVYGSKLMELFGK